MAIHPRYADAILDGRKKVEFRKRGVAEDVTTVLIYATAPVKKIIGEFQVAHIVVATPSALWHQLGGVGCIEESAYRAYYGASESAVGLVVEAPERYEVAVGLGALIPAPAVPQSFAYLPRDLYEQTQLLGQPTNRGSIQNAVQRLTQLMRRLIKQHLLASVTPTTRGLASEERKEDEHLAALP